MKSIKTKKVTKINDKTLIATLDIGKNIQYGYFRAPNGNDVKPFAFYNSKKSYNEFWEKLCQFKDKEGLEQIVIGFESTGPYAEPLFHFLRKKPVTLVQVNPVHTKRVKELTGNSPNKTDNKDPRVIADVICLGHALTLVVPEGPAAELRRLTQARERAITDRTAIINQLQHLIFVIFPEFLKVLKISTKTARYFIKHFTTPEKIFALGLDSVAQIVKKVSRGKLGQDRAKQLHEAAENSIGISEGKQSIVFEIEHLIGRIEAEDQFIDSLEKQMRIYLQQIPYSQNILSIKGLGEVTVAGLIGEVADFNKFDTISEVMKLAGLDLYEISSGNHRGQRRISKRGRPLMRKLLFFAAINAVKSKGIMHAKYQDNTKYVENYSDNYHYKLAA
jgi:transposase